MSITIFLHVRQFTLQTLFPLKSNLHREKFICTQIHETSVNVITGEGKTENPRAKRMTVVTELNFSYDGDALAILRGFYVVYLVYKAILVHDYFGFRVFAAVHKFTLITSY